MRHLFTLLLTVALGLAPVSLFGAATGGGTRAAGKAAFDSAAVHALYVDGDFDQAIAILEGDVREKRLRNHADSVFAFKHLGVMYAAQEATREKGKYYMLQLLYVEPTARIMDMYASDMIYMIFRNIQEEFSHDPGRHRPPPGSKSPALEAEGEGRDAAPQAAAGTARAEPKPAPRAPESGAVAAPKSHRLYWFAGGAVLVGAGVAAYYLMSAPSPVKEFYVVE
jgi:hypothetical protein